MRIQPKAIVPILATLALAGCGSTPAEEAKLTHERKEYERVKGIESEEHEAEAVIKHRAAEETANAIEGATGH